MKSTIFPKAWGLACIKILLSCFLLYCFIFIPASANAYPASIESQEFSERVLKIIRDNPQVLYESIQDYYQIQIEKQREEQAALLKSITSSNEIVSDSPRKGDAEYKVVLIEFSDFQCPYCAEAYKVLKHFVENHQNEVTLVYKHYPLAQIHSESISAATASWAAFQQNKFWEFHDFLFSHQDEIGETLYQQAATELTLNLVQFEQDRNSQDAKNAIQRDTELAEKIGISGTPFFIMGEEIFSGAVDESFLEAQLAKM
ncbi:MAG: thioredoxin domain-containing protein [Cyanobacteria bacterium J06560_6]